MRDISDCSEMNAYECAAAMTGRGMIGPPAEGSVRLFYWVGSLPCCSNSLLINCRTTRRSKVSHQLPLLPSKNACLLVLDGCTFSTAKFDIAGANFC